MKTEQPRLITSVKAGEDLPKNVFINFAGYKADDEICLGVCNAGTDLGEEAPVMINGIALVLSSASIGQGDYVKPASGGKAVTVIGDPYADPAIRGLALDSASGADELIRVLLR